MDIASILKEQWIGGNALNSLPTFLVNLILTAILTWILGWVYTKFGESLSNRKIFARNFLMLALTTMLVISIVKSSLALSLGLVGALSIVRFRAAIKEPEELVYLFLAIGIGLGLGAEEPLLTICALIVILGIIMLRKLGHTGAVQNNVCVHLSSAKQIALTNVVKVFAEVGATASLRRFDEMPERTEFSFVVQFVTPERLEEFSRAIKNLDPEMKVSFVDDRGLGM
ncbi:MAG: DUF4956 domain-containing protein [Verrucomicrobia bacterium]|nr:DUF4956 domain-containing protein [Verrucomicrobiota bacterium]